MNNYCRELNLSKDLYPKIDLSKYSTEGYTWATFHKILTPSELNNNYLLTLIYQNTYFLVDKIYLH